MGLDHEQPVTRRDLLRAASALTVGAGGAALLAPGIASARARRDDRPYGPFRMGIQS